MKFYKCEKCGNIILEINNKCVCSCCGQTMTELVANDSDGAFEKHVPVVEVNGSNVNVKCGEVIHPMEEKHYIEFIVLETDKGNYIKYLNPGVDPVCDFCLCNDEKYVRAYAYCNLHGLWKSNN